MIDLYAIGTPAIDFTIELNSEEIIKEYSLKKNDTNQVSIDLFNELIEKYEKNIFIKTAGDNARNVCEASSLFSTKSAYFGLLGNCGFSKYFQDSLSLNSIKNNCLVKQDSFCGRILTLLSSDGSRTFVSFVKYQEEVEEIIAQDSNMLFLTSITLKPNTKISKASLDYVKEFKGLKIISLESSDMLNKYGNFYKKILSYFDILFCNESEFKSLFKNEDYSMLNNYFDISFIKKGKQGSIAITENEIFKIKSINVDPVDTSGAGDYYAGGVISGINQKKSILEMMKMGSYCASQIIQIYGTQFFR